MCPGEQPLIVTVEHLSSGRHDTVEVDLRAGAASLVLRRGVRPRTVTTVELSLGPEELAAWTRLAAAVTPHDQARVVEDFFGMFTHRLVVRRGDGAAHPEVVVENPRGALCDGAPFDLLALGATLVDRAERGPGPAR